MLCISIESPRVLLTPTEQHSSCLLWLLFSIVGLAACISRDKNICGQAQKPNFPAFGQATAESMYQASDDDAWC